jgi:hypothetical protein
LLGGAFLFPRLTDMLHAAYHFFSLWSSFFLMTVLWSAVAAAAVFFVNFGIGF